MNELTRFLHVRSPQRIAEENMPLIGLNLYHDSDQSELANTLKKVACDKENYSNTINKFKEADNGKAYINDFSKINSAILTLYKWLDYKAKPINKSDFETFVQNELSNKLGALTDIKQEWIKCADNLLVATFDKVLVKNHLIDFQLLIRTIHVFEKCLNIDVNNSKVDVKGSEKLLNAIITARILLPAGVIMRHACCKGEDSQGPNDTISLVEKRTDKDKCTCKCNEGICVEPSTHCMCFKPYTAELFIVKEELNRYEEGDIASIENILAGENKVRKHRNLFRTEDTREEETEVTSSEERDHQVSDKFSLQSEVNNTVQSTTNKDAGVTATMKYGENITIQAHANVTANNSKSQSEKIARSYAKDIVDRSATKIQEKVRNLSISKIINEVEERNKHSIDNTVGEDRAGLYYWVNKVSRAQVYNYGKRSMFDVIIPEPATIFKKLLELKEEKIKESAPKKTSVLSSGINRGNYQSILNQYGITGSEAPPNQYTWIQFSFHHNITEPKREQTSSGLLGWGASYRIPPSAFSVSFESPQIPLGYRARKMDYDIRCSTAHPMSTVGSLDEIAVTVNFGVTRLFNKSFNEYETPGELNHDWENDTKTLPMNGEEGILNIAVGGFSTLALSITGAVSIQCELTSEKFEAWQLKVYDLIMGDYLRKLQAYENSQPDDFGLIQIKGRNPFLNREIERNELKRNIIAALMCNYFREPLKTLNLKKEIIQDLETF